MPREVWRAWLGTRIGLLLLVVLTDALGLFSYPTPNNWQAFPDCFWLDAWSRWDSAFYVDIAAKGYADRDLANFFPFYPLCIALVAPLCQLVSRQPFHLAAILLAWVSFPLALCGLHRWVRQRVDETTADRCVWLTCCWPTAFYYSAAYTEPIYLCLGAWAFAFACEQRWARACVLAGLAAVIRPPGFLLAVALFVQFLAEGPRRRQFFYFFLTPLGVLAWLAFLQHRFHDSLLFVHTQQARGAVHLQEFFAAFWRSVPFSYEGARSIQDHLCFVATVLAWPLTWRLGAGAALFAGGSTAVACLGMASTARYVGAGFPIYAGLATRPIPRIVLAGLFFLQVVYAGLFAHWRWVG